MTWSFDLFGDLLKCPQIGLKVILPNNDFWGIGMFDGNTN
jgi:hypothetical protein